MKESFWGDLYGQTKLAWKQFFEAESERQRDRYAAGQRISGGAGRRQDYRNGYYERDFVTRFGTIRLRVARTRGKSFLPRGLEPFQRRAPEVALLIREAFLRGISHAAGGTGGGHADRRSGERADGVEVDAATWTKRCASFIRRGCSDDYAYLFLDGVSLRVRRPAGRKRVQMLVAYGVRRDGTRHLLAFLRSQGESQSDWEGLLQDLYRRGLEGQQLRLDRHRRLCRTGGGDSHRLSAGAASALLGAQDAQYLGESAQARLRRGESRGQAIYLAESRAHAEAAFRRFRARWRTGVSGRMVRRLERDLPELLSFFAFPRHLWRKLRTTNVIERCFVEVRRRTRPMVCFVNVESVDRIIYSIFQRFNLEWKTRTLNLFTQAA